MQRLFGGFIHVLTLGSSTAIFRRVISENIPQLLKEIPKIPGRAPDYGGRHP